MSLNILPECYADTELIKILGFKRANHCSNIGEVANRMQKNYTRKLAIGVVDNDKPGKPPSYFKKFKVIENCKGFDIKHLEHTKHYLIVIDPALEQFILNTAENLKISTKKYGFKNLKSLLRVTKKKTISQNQKFKDLLNTLRQKKNSPLQEMTNKLNSLLGENS